VLCIQRLEIHTISIHFCIISMMWILVIFIVVTVFIHIFFSVFIFAFILIPFLIFFFHFSVYLVYNNFFYRLISLSPRSRVMSLSFMDLLSNLSLFSGINEIWIFVVSRWMFLRVVANILIFWKDLPSFAGSKEKRILRFIFIFRVITSSTSLIAYDWLVFWFIDYCSLRYWSLSLFIMGRKLLYFRSISLLWTFLLTWLIFILESIRAHLSQWWSASLSFQFNNIRFLVDWLGNIGSSMSIFVVKLSFSIWIILSWWKFCWDNISWSSLSAFISLFMIVVHMGISGIVNILSI